MKKKGEPGDEDAGMNACAEELLLKKCIMPEPVTILIVYDSRSIRETVSVLSNEPAFKIIELDDPQQVEECVEEVLPSLVIICAMTRTTTAYDSCRQVKELTAGGFVPVMLYALKAGAEEREQAFMAGADDLVPVNTSHAELMCRIRSLLRVRETVIASQQRTRNIAQASAEAADMMLQLEEADRRIREQNRELEKMVRELEERDIQIRAQQNEIQKHLETLQKEMELASTLQVNLLPSAPPDVRGLSLYDRYVPAAELCGDYYDYVSLPDGTFHVSIADVTGHGVAPALVSVQVRTMAQTAVRSSQTPAQVLEALNVFMFDTFRQDFLMTMVGMNYNPETCALTYSGAGHCPILHYDVKAGEVRELFSRGMPLGVSRAAAFVDETVTLGAGDRVLLYTDGITEVPGDDPDDIFGMKRLINAFSDSMKFSGRDALGMIFQAARSHASGGAFDDDVTLVLLEQTV